MELAPRKWTLRTHLVLQNLFNLESHADVLGVGHPVGDDGGLQGHHRVSMPHSFQDLGRDCHETSGEHFRAWDETLYRRLEPVITWVAEKENNMFL